jgi:hypothetical protein
LNFAQLNALPANMPELEDWRDNVAMRVRSMSVEAYNKYDDSENAEKIIELALRFKVSPTIAKRIESDKQALHTAKREKEAAKDNQAKEFLDILTTIADKLRYLGRNETPNPDAIEKLLKELLTYKYMQNLSTASYSIRAKIASTAESLLRYLPNYSRRPLTENLYLYIGGDVLNPANRSHSSSPAENDGNSIPPAVKILFVVIIIIVIMVMANK